MTGLTVTFLATMTCSAALRPPVKTLWEPDGKSEEVASIEVFVILNCMPSISREQLEHLRCMASARVDRAKGFFLLHE